MAKIEKIRGLTKTIQSKLYLCMNSNINMIKISNTYWLLTTWHILLFVVNSFIFVGNLVFYSTEFRFHLSVYCVINKDFILMIKPNLVIHSNQGIILWIIWHCSGTYLVYLNSWILITLLLWIIEWISLYCISIMYDFYYQHEKYE